MSGRAPQSPATNTDATNVTNSVDDVRVRAAATGSEAELIHEALIRIEAATQVLTNVAFTGESPILDQTIVLLDKAAMLIEKAS